jgi:KDO2-lipid IV(A) lauroyltransferase
LRKILGALLRVVWKYRRKVLRANLLRIYPDWTIDRRLQLERRFYEYLGGLLWDLIRSSLADRDYGKDRVHWENPEIMDTLVRRGTSLVLLTSHYGNWEWIAQAMGSRFEHALWFVYKPIQWKAGEKWLLRWRSRRYVVPVALKDLRIRLAAELPSLLSRPIAVYLGADQSPTARSRWIPTNFLGQPSAVYQGPEELCRTYGLAPVWMHIRPLAHKGSYSVKFVLPKEDWSADKHGSLMHWYMDSLSRQINDAPEYWLWTHRRWKLNRELGLEGTNPTFPFESSSPYGKS